MKEWRIFEVNCNSFFIHPNIKCISQVKNLKINYSEKEVSFKANKVNKKVGCLEKRQPT